MEQADFLLFLTATHNAGDLQQEKPLKEVWLGGRMGTDLYRK